MKKKWVIVKVGLKVDCPSEAIVGLMRRFNTWYEAVRNWVAYVDFEVDLREEEG